MAKKKQSHYDALGLNKNADSAAIKKAYRKAAMKHHPDRGGKPENFHPIQRAYETLSNGSKRAYYDEHGEDEAPKVDPAAKIQNELLGLFMSMIDQYDPEHDDLIGFARNAIAEREKAIPGELKKLQRKVRKVESAIIRLKHKGKGVNFLAQMLHVQVEQMKDLHEKGSKVFEQLKLIRNMIDEYEYLFDARPFENPINSRSDRGSFIDAVVATMRNR